MAKITFCSRIGQTVRRLKPQKIGDHEVTVLSSPSNSPGLNVIETVWRKRKPILKNKPIRTLPELKRLSMPKRIQAVIKCKGDVTPFLLVFYKTLIKWPLNFFLKDRKYISFESG